MLIVMKNQVLDFLRNLPSKKEEKFNKAFALLAKTPTANQTLLRSYNQIGATDSNIANIIYDLKKYNFITDVMIRATPKAKVITQSLAPDNLLTEPKLPSDAKENEKRTSLQEEFPFLSAKDCPVEIHIVTGALVASYKRYEALMQKIQLFKDGKLELTADEDLELTGEAAAEFEDNKKLYNELEYYRENQKLLAEHDILKEYRWKKEFEAMPVDEMFRYKNNAASYISKNQPEVDNPKVDEKRRDTLREKIKQREFIVALINQKLNSNA